MRESPVLRHRLTERAYATLSRVKSTTVDKRASIASLLTELDEAAPGGFAIALHIKSHAPTFLFQTFPVAWVEYYHTHGLVMKDPMMHWAFANTGTLRWREMADADPAGVIANAKRHGMAYGCTTSIHGEASRSLAGFTRSDRDFLDVEINEIYQKFKRLELATAGLDEVSNADKQALKEMSIRLTHS